MGFQNKKLSGKRSLGLGRSGVQDNILLRSSVFLSLFLLRYHFLWYLSLLSS